MPGLVQKNLDWLWRLFFYSPDQPLPLFDRVIRPVIDISLDWPQTLKTESKVYLTAAGLFVESRWTPPAGKHWVVEHWSTTGAFPAADTIIAQLLTGTNNQDQRLCLVSSAAALACIGFVGSGTTGAAGTYSAGFRERMYIPEGYTLSIAHSSVAGGVNFTNAVTYREYPSYQPNPL